MSRRFFLLAGETSGDHLGAALMAGLKTLDPGVEFHGVGGARMQAEGLESLFPMSELSVMGIAEVLPRYRMLKRRIDESARAVLSHDLDALITIDSPDFNLRVARRVRARSRLRMVHYVAPSVWAWRAGRAQRMAQTIDQVLGLFPFDEAPMRAAGMRCDFVGHPIAAHPPVDARTVRERRAALGLAPDQTALLVLPGSRQGEISRLGPVFAQTLRQMHAVRGDVRAIVPAAPGRLEQVRASLGDLPGHPIILPTEGQGAPDKRQLFAAADLALAASGTVSLELAAARVPTVIAYDMNWLSWQIISRMVKVDTVTLVNLIAESRTIPEFLGPECRPERIAPALTALIDDGTARAAQIEAMDLAMTRLGAGGPPPGLRAARAVLDGLDDAGGSGGWRPGAPASSSG